MQTLPGRTAALIRACGVSADGGLVAASTGYELKLWDGRTRQELATFRGPPSPRDPEPSRANSAAFAISPSGDWVVTVDVKELAVWDLTIGERRGSLIGHTDWVTTCDVSPDGSFLVSGSEDETARIWDAASHEEIATLRGHDAEIRRCAVSADGSFVVSMSQRDVRLWDIADGAPRGVLNPPGWLKSFDLSADGSIIATIGGRRIRVWDTAACAELAVLRTESSELGACAIAPDGSFIAAGTWDGKLRLWDAATYEERASFIAHTAFGGTRMCAVTPDSSVVISGGGDKAVKFWKAQDGALLTAVDNDLEAETCAISPDGSYVVWPSFRTVRALELPASSSWVAWNLE